MIHNEVNTTKSDNKKTKSKRVLDVLLKIGAFFIILEPIWMLLPFAGFLYGSVMHIEVLSRHLATSWLVHFVLPVHTLFPVGLILIVLGFLIFLVGASQIYLAKLLKKGQVKTGLYRYFRHPQYLALTVFGIGILLTWGRFITYIAFFIMLWLYYFLSKSEEKNCLEFFGKEYEDHCKKTFFLFPGEKYISAFVRRSFLSQMPKWTAVIVSFVLVMSVAIGSGLLIQNTKIELRNTLPVIEGTFTVSTDASDPVKLLMVKGPALQAAPSQKVRDQFMDKFFEALRSSSKINEALGKYDLGKDHTLLAFLTPGSNWYDGAHGDYKKAKVNVFLLVMKTPVAFTGDNFREFRNNWKILKLVRAKELSYNRMEAGQDPVEGEVIIKGPPLGKKGLFFQIKMKERINFFLSGV